MGLTSIVKTLMFGIFALNCKIFLLVKNIFLKIIISACEMGHLEVVKILMTNQLNVNMVDHKGESALMKG